MNELIEGLSNLVSNVGGEIDDLCKTISGDKERINAERMYNKELDRYKKITIILFFVCAFMCCIKYFIL